MNVSLTPELERRIQEKVESGLYTSASEVVREGLRLLFEAEDLTRRRLVQLNADVKRGLDQAGRGELISGDDVFAAVTGRTEAWRGRQQGGR